jgi:hypothetical protein
MKEIINIRDKQKTEKQKKKINETKSWFSENTNNR